MKIVMRGAYAGSDNNLEQEQTRDVEDISNRTNKLLTFFGKTWSDENKVYIDNFLDALDNLTFKDKIKMLMIMPLMPNATQLETADINAINSIYTKNLAGEDAMGDAYALSAAYGYIKIDDDGAKFEDGGSGIGSAARWRMTVSQYAVSNKNFHYGTYFKTSDKYSSQNRNPIRPRILVNSTSNSGSITDGIRVDGDISVGYEQLVVLNGNVTESSGKSYIDGEFVDTTIDDAALEATIDSAGMMMSGVNNDADDSTCSLVTFGESLSDSEMEQYVDLLEYIMEKLLP